MIKLNSLKLKNFISHKNTVIEFKDTQKLLIDGISGSGKSSLVEALLWCLYNRGRSDNNRSLIKYGDDEASVVLIIDKNSTLYKIERVINTKGRHTLKVSEKTGKTFKPIKVEGIKNIQEYLEKEILESSYTLFINSIVFPQDNIENFIKQTASKRKEIFLEIVRAGRYEEYNKRTKEKISEFNLMASELDGKIIAGEGLIKEQKIIAEGLEEWDTQYKQHQKTKTNLDNQLKELKEKEKEFLVIKNSYELKEKEFNGIKIELEELKKKGEDVKKRIEGIENGGTTIVIDETGLEKDRKRLTELKLLSDSLREWKDKYSELLQNKPIDTGFNARIEKLNKNIIDLLNKEIDFCPDLNKECSIMARERDFRIEEFRKELKEAQVDKDKHADKESAFLNSMEKLGPGPTVNFNEIKLLEDNIESTENLKSQKELQEKERSTMLNILKSNLPEIEEKIYKLNTKYTFLKNELDALNEKMKEFNMLPMEISNVEYQVGENNSDLEESYKKLSEAQNASNLIEKTFNSIKSHIEEKNALERKIEGLKLLRDAFSPNGITAIVIDYYIPKLEDKINEILGKLSDFQIKIDTQREGVGDDVVLEGLFISIINEHGEELDFQNYSGGEKLRINFAIFEGLASLQQYGFRILDESIIGLDDSTINSFAEIILQLRENINQLICISHIQSIKDLFDERIVIKKNKDTSFINK